eukprot:2413393-Amphidinium_carterae.1
MRFLSIANCQMPQPEFLSAQLACRGVQADACRCTCISRQTAWHKARTRANHTQTKCTGLANVPMEGQERARYFMHLANELDVLASEQTAKEAACKASVAEPQQPPVLASHMWAPRWMVLRGHDSWPGQDVGRPVRCDKHLGELKAFSEAKGLAGLVMAGGLAYARPP